MTRVGRSIVGGVPHGARVRRVGVGFGGIIVVGLCPGMDTADRAQADDHEQGNDASPCDSAHVDLSLIKREQDKRPRAHEPGGALGTGGVGVTTGAGGAVSVGTGANSPPSGPGVVAVMGSEVP